MQILQKLLNGVKVDEESKKFIENKLRDKFNEEELEVLNKAIDLLPRWEEFGNELKEWLD